MRSVAPETGPAIRRALPRDIPAMAGLLAILFDMEADFRPDRSAQERGLALLLGRADGAACVLVAECCGTVAGMCSVQALVSTAEGGPVGMVEDLIVAEAFRGRGIGRALIQGIEEWSCSRGLLRLQLLADMSNEAGQGFYCHTGWLGTRLICLRKVVPFGSDGLP
jgi:GNAT superfamily N-acetyltransferase